MSNNIKIKVWEKYCGSKSQCYDYSGRIIHYSAYNNRNSRFGWNIDHIRPVSGGGTDQLCNLIPTHILTNDEKGDSFPHWEANGAKFKAIRIAKNCYKIVKNN